MKIESLFDRIKSYVTRLSWFFLILETLVSIVIGCLIGGLIAGEDYWGITIAIGIIYLALLYLKFSSQKLFPSAVIEELKSKSELKRQNLQLARRDQVSELINELISGLNSQTCTLTGVSDNQLCNLAIKEGLEKLILPLISRPHYLFDCNKSQFTVGAYVSYPLETPNVYNDSFLIFRDDLELCNDFDDSFLKSHELSGINLDLQKSIQRCNNEGRFISDSLTNNNDDIIFICSPIPIICNDDYVDGILFFALQSEEDCPVDLESTLKIIGRIIANWISKYSDCVISSWEFHENGSSENFDDRKN